MNSAHTSETARPLLLEKSPDSILDAIYICYWSLKDPLCQTQSLSVVRAMARRGYRIALITYEQERYRLERLNAHEERLRLAQEGIRWIPLRHHVLPALFGTLLDILLGAATVSRIVREKKVRLLHARATIPAAIAWCALRLKRTLFFYDVDNFLSGEYADIGRWSRQGLPYRLTRWVEDRCVAAADHLSVLTHAWKQELPAHQAPLEVIPCAVNIEHFRFDSRSREALRRRYDLHGTVFIYAGKYGGWYLVEPMIDFFSIAREIFSKARLIILTNGNQGPFRKLLKQRNLRNVSEVLTASHDEMPSWLSAADVGLSFILPAPSKRASSPVKNGEYLACGLPVVTTAGIGDYSDLVRREKVGCVVQELTPEHYQDAARQLHNLFESPDIRERCRNAVKQNLSLDIIAERYARIYKELLGPARCSGMDSEP